MIAEAVKKNRKKKLSATYGISRTYPVRECLFPRSANLYRFIRLMLGPAVSDRQIARRWRMDQKNFSYFRDGKTPVPRLERLEQLARVLGINKHLVFEVACGASAKMVFNLIRKNDRPGQIRLLQL